MKTMKTKGYSKGGMKQGYNARLDDSMGARNGSKSQPMQARRNESKGMRNPWVIELIQAI